ncbi:2-phosphosulfolactate phosphatase [[Brevibacterium] frigoritolerans]|uniref:Probable 2-phosphosulfolactate phosphatase n=1 Tax=Peribacillus frigoritolerans TaxID=450367 RepID=A0A941FJP5_9BACI|nr:2-phosphosulfolactate phosphatase [Peribacillus frigoritolerans]
MNSVWKTFYGAGHLIDCLIAGSQGTFILNDAAKAANALYRTNSENAFDILKSSYVGQLFAKHSLIADLELAAQKVHWILSQSWWMEGSKRN